jgi:hypothetical protein
MPVIDLNTGKDWNAGTLDDKVENRFDKGFVCGTVILITHRNLTI